MYENTLKLIKLKKDFFFKVSLFSILFLFNFHQFKNWFIIDDTANIVSSFLPAVDLLFDPKTYAYFNHFFFTPLLPILFKIDWPLFKFAPIGYHLHNFIIAFLCLLIYQKMIEVFYEKKVSYLAAILFAISLPITIDIGWITRKHYLWGFLFSLLSIYLFYLYLSKEKIFYLLLSPILYFLALLCKEAYFILPIFHFSLFIFFKRASLKTSLIYISLFFFPFLLYLTWRFYMLGGIGGYPGSTDKSLLEYLISFLLLPFYISHSLMPYLWIFLLLLSLFLFFQIPRLFALLWILLLFISLFPFIFLNFKESFIIANKALIFTGLLCLLLSYLFFSFLSKIRYISFAALLAYFYCIIIPSINAQNLLNQLSKSYFLSSQPLLKGEENFVIISSHPYYFDSLFWILRSKNIKPFFSNNSSQNIIFTSDPLIFSFLNKDFNKIILAENLFLSPKYYPKIKILKDKKAFLYIKKYKKNFLLPPPQVNFLIKNNILKIIIKDKRKGQYIRCLYRLPYIGCYEIPKKYKYLINHIRNTQKICIFLKQGNNLSQESCFYFTK